MEGKQEPEPGESAVHEAGESPVEELVEQAVQQAATSPDPALAPLLAAYDPARDGDPPQWAPDADLWAQAKQAIAPTWASHQKPYDVVAHIYKAMGGNVAAAVPGAAAPPKPKPALPNAQPRGGVM
jgi:hypothetical protein